MKNIFKKLIFVFLLFFGLFSVGFSSIQIISVADPPNTGAFGGSGSAINYYVAENFSLSNYYKINSIDVFVSKIGSVGNTIVRIENSINGYPSGSLVNPNASITVTPNEMGIWTNVAKINKQFSSPILLEPNKEYFIVYRLYYNNLNNRAGAGVNSYNSFSNGTRFSSSNLGSSWSTINQDVSFNLYGSLYTINNVPTIEQNITDYYNLENISIQLNTTSNVNISYSLDNGNLNLICSNCNNTILNLTNLSEGFHSILFESKDSNGVVNSTANFTIDLTNPTINIFNTSEINSYYVDWTQIFNYSDLNLNTCEIIVENTTQNCVSYTFTNNGNQTIKINVNDSAGNFANQTFQILVNPYQYFYFYDINGSLINNFYFGEKFFENFSKLKVFNDILIFGNNSLTFKKLGYKTTNFSFNINSNSKINISYNISKSKILIHIINKETLKTISGINFSLDFIGDLGFSDWTNTGYKNISNIFFNNQDYNLIVKGSGFKTENIFFKFNNYEDLPIDVYMLNSSSNNLGNVYIYTVDNFGGPLKNVIVQALQWDSSKSSYIKVSEIKTDDSGVGNLNVVLDSKLYTFRAIYNNQIIDSVSQTIATNDNGKTIVLTLPTKNLENNYLLKNIIFNVSEKFDNSTNISTFFFSWNNLDGTKINGCISAYRLYVGTNSKQLINRNCSIFSASANMIQSYFINSSTDILISAEINDSNKFITIKSFTYYSDFQINKIFENYGLDIFSLPILFIISIILGISISPVFGGIGVILSGGAGIYLAPQFITKSIVVFLIFIGIAIIIGGNKRK